MKSIAIHPCIVKSKVLADGSHKIRLSVAHRGETRYIPTRFSVPSEKNITKRGEVVGLPNSAYINKQLRELVNKAYSICDETEGSEFLSCSQLVQLIESEQKPDSHMTFSVVADEWIRFKNVSCKPQTVVFYLQHLRRLKEFMGGDFALTLLTPSVINKFALYTKPLISSSFRYSLFSTIKSFLSFAQRRGYVQFRIDPFVDLQMPHKTVRECALSVNDLRKLIVYKPKKKGEKESLDLFLITFFMCGMNMTDLLDVDFTKPSVDFIRHKNVGRSSNVLRVKFTIPEEAKALAEPHLSSEGRLCPSGKNKEQMLARRNYEGGLRRIREKVLPDCPRLIMYSARKTFAQIAAELGTQDSVIEYCLGDVPSMSKTINFYRRPTKEMADKAIRNVIDFVYSNMTLQEYIDAKR